MMPVDALIDEMVARIRECFAPRRIILFGSRARGTADPDSDVDLLVVFDQVDDRRRCAVDIRRALADLPIAKDIVVAVGCELAEEADMVGSVIRSAMREGVVLYDRA